LKTTFDGISFLPFFKSEQEMKEWNLPLGSKILFFGGTFNPWHEGHRSCLELAPKDIPLIILPDRNPTKDLMPFSENQIKQLQVELESLPSFKLMTLFLGFLKQPHPNPTINWLNHLKSKRSDLKVYLLMGFDSFESLPRWIEGEKVIMHLNGVFVVARKENDESFKKAQEQLLSINSNLDVHYLGHHPFEDLSSTNLRKKKGS
jgi:nicotinate-nucleotide adenylyltransferase